MEEQQRLIHQVRLAVGLAYGTATSASIPKTREAGLDRQQRREADEWLQEFQRSQMAWQVADALLMAINEPPENQYFAAQTLHAKLQYDFHELPVEAISSLRDSLLNHLKRVSAGNPSKALVIRLCLALSALAVQMNWRDCIAQLCTVFPPGELTTSGTVLLELLVVLPEEATSSRLLVDEATRHSFMEQLFAAVPQVLEYLCHVQKQVLESSNSSARVHVSVLECFETWIQNCQIPVAMLSQCPLMDWTLRQALVDQSLFEASVNVLVSTLQTYCLSQPEDYHPDKMALAQLLVPALMGQQVAYQQALHNGDDETCQGLCRLFTEMAEAYLQLLLAEVQIGQVELLGLVLQGTAHQDHEIAAITFNFWYRFIHALHCLKPEELKQSKIEEYRLGFVRFAEICLHLLKLPEDFAQLSEDLAEDVHKFRDDVGGNLEDCCLILGPAAVLAIPATTLQNQMAAANSTQGDWQVVEACLFAVQSVAKHVPETESTIIPPVLQILPQLSQLHSLVRRTANVTVREYATFLCHHAELLQPLFAFLLSSFADPTCASSAANAIKQVCKRCSPLLGISVLSLAGELEQARKEGRITASAELEVLEGLCHVTAGIQPPETAAEAVKALAQPIGQQFSVFIAQGGGDVKEITAEIDRLTVVVRFCQPKIPQEMEHPVLEVMQAAWPLLDALLNYIQTCNHAVERMCRLYKHALRTCKRRFAPLLRPLMNQLLERFRAHPHSAYIYAASICVTEFSRKQEYIPELFIMIESISAEIVARLRTLEEFTEHPDLVEEYFYLMARVLSYCPGPLLRSELISSVVQFGIVGLQLKHREAQSGILSFFEELISTGIESPHNKNAQEYLASLQPLLQNFGLQLVEGVVQILSGVFPAYSWEDSGGTIGGVLYKLFHLSEPAFKAWLTPSVESIPSNVATASEKTEFLSQIITQPDRDCFCDVIYSFAKLCRQRLRKWHR